VKCEAEMMTKPGPTTEPSVAGGSVNPRVERLAEALKANLRRRKIQVQERARNRAAEAGQKEAGPGKQAGQESRNDSTDTSNDSTDTNYEPPSGPLSQGS
jgi:hypothetical protein